MYRIRLVNLPFAALQFPSLALTQLKSVVQTRCAHEVDVQVVYANHAFADLPGETLYQQIATSVLHGQTGLGDWLFRQAAFPDLPDNASEYFARCYPRRDEAHERFRQAILQVRGRVAGWLDELIDRNHLDRVDLVGMTSMFSQNVACFALARRIKERHPNVTTVLGGANCEHPMGEEIARQVDALDFVFSGPALRSFPEFVQHRLRKRFDACHRIDGVFSHQNLSALPAFASTADELPPDHVTTLTSADTIAEPPNPLRVLGAELPVNETIPLNYDDFLESFAHCRCAEPSLLFETSRGCWWGERAHCTFCGLNGLTMKYRAMSPARALAQFAELFLYADRLPRLELQCVDNILPREYLRDVFPKLETPANVSIFYEVKSDLKPEDVATLARARVLSIQPGIEALATSTLQLMRKGTTAFQSVSLLKRCAQHGIQPHWNLLIGFPGESADVYRKYLRDLPHLVHLPPPTGVFPVRFDRYSPYVSQPQTYNLDLRPCEFYRFIYPFDDQALANIAYFFFDNNFRADYFVQMVEWIGPLQHSVQGWGSRYSGQDGRPRAELYVVDEEPQPFVFDSRAEEIHRHALTATGARLLELLEEPHDRGWLAREVAGVKTADWESELERLLRLGLLFEEQGRYLSLVQPQSRGQVAEHSAGKAGVLQNS